MKRAFITCLIVVSGLMSLAQTGQGERTFYEIKTRSDRFLTNIPAGKIILQADSVRWLKLTQFVRAGWKLDTVYKMGWWKPSESLSGISSEWKYQGGSLMNIDTNKVIYMYSSSYPWNAGLTLDPQMVGLYRSSGASTGSGLLMFTEDGIYFQEYTPGKSQGISLNAQTGMGGTLFGNSGYNKTGRMNLGSSSARWGKIYADTADFNGTITATGGNSTQWNAGYSGRVTGASGTSPLTLTWSNNSLTGSIGQAGSSSNGYLTSTDWNAFNGKVSSQWTTTTDGIYNTSGTVAIGTNIIDPLFKTIFKSVRGSQATALFTDTTNQGFYIGGGVNPHAYGFYDYSGDGRIFEAVYSGGNYNKSIFGASGALVVTNDNKVGVNTLSPTSTLDVNGTITATGGNSGYWNTAYSNRITSASGTSPLTLTISSNSLSGSISEASSSANGYLSSTDWTLFNNKVSSQWQNASETYGNIMYLDSVGIGNDSPRALLDVAGDAYISGNTIHSKTIGANLKSSGTLIKLQAGATNAVGDVVFIAATTGKTSICKADAIANCPYALAICTQSVSTDGYGYYMTNGVLRNDSWNWTIGGILYIRNDAVSGTCLTHSAPASSNNVIMPVAVALSATSIYFYGNINSVEKQ